MLRHITNYNSIDGFGAQYQQIIYSMFYAEMNNIPFVYTPFKNMEHNYVNDLSFLKKKEELINVTHIYKVRKDESYMEFSDFTFISFYEKNIKHFSHSQTLKNLRLCFFQNKKKPRYFSSSKVSIAIHVRRNNSHDTYKAGSDVPDGVYIELIQNLKSLYPKCIIHIYSQGSMENFGKYASIGGLMFHLDESVEETFIGFVYADVLVVSSSAFSYTAGLLNKNTIYYIQHYNPPLPHWNVIEGYKSTRNVHMVYVTVPVIYDPKENVLKFAENVFKSYLKDDVNPDVVVVKSLDL